MAGRSGGPSLLISSLLANLRTVHGMAITDTAAAYEQFTTGAAPGNPASGRRLYSKTVASQAIDGNMFFRDSFGNEWEMLAHRTTGTLGAFVRQITTGQTVGQNWTTLTFNYEAWDYETVGNGMANLGTNNDRLTMQTPGLYFCYAAAEIPNVGTDLYGMKLLHSSGIAFAQAFFGNNNVTAISVAGVYRFAAADYVRAQFYKAAAGNQTLSVGDVYQSCLSAVRLGP